jgi:hypothetical protein
VTKNFIHTHNNRIRLTKTGEDDKTGKDDMDDKDTKGMDLSSMKDEEKATLLKSLSDDPVMKGILQAEGDRRVAQAAAKIEAKAQAAAAEALAKAENERRQQELAAKGDHEQLVSELQKQVNVLQSEAERRKFRDDASGVLIELGCPELITLCATAQSLEDVRAIGTDYMAKRQDAVTRAVAEQFETGPPPPGSQPKKGGAGGDTNIMELSDEEYLAYRKTLLPADRL